MEMKPTIDLYLEYCLSKQLRPKSLHAYGQGLNLFAAWLEEETEITQVEDIRDAAIRKYMLDLQVRGKYTAYADEKAAKINYPHHRTDYGQKISNTTINNYLRYMRGFFGWLVEMEYLEKNPMKRIKLLPNQRVAKEYLEDREIMALLGVMDKENYAEYRDLVVFMILFDCGTRLGETLSIEMDQIDLMNRAITLPANKTKGRKERTVFFSNRTARELKKWLQFKEKACDSEYAFPIKASGDRLQVRNYEANFRRYLKRTTISKHVTPHTLRNNFAKRCFLSGMDIYTLSRILGHSSVKVTEKAYLDVKDHELKKRYVQHSPLERVYGK